MEREKFVMRIDERHVEIQSRRQINLFSLQVISETTGDLVVWMEEWNKNHQDNYCSSLEGCGQI